MTLLGRALRERTHHCGRVCDASIAFVKAGYVLTSLHYFSDNFVAGNQLQKTKKVKWTDITDDRTRSIPGTPR